MVKLIAGIATLLVVAAIVGLIWAAVVFDPREFGSVVGTATQIAGGFVTVAVGIFASAGFLIRKKQRVDELQRHIREMASDLTSHYSYLPKDANAEGIVNYRSTASQLAIDDARAIREMEDLYAEYKFWARVFRLGLKPRPL